MHYTVYQITNKINGKVYIGKHQTKDLDDGYMGSGKNIQRALKKYGVENFSKEILFVFENEESMNAKEKELVTEEFCLQEDTYNICVGGQGGFSYINREGLNGTLDGRHRSGVTTTSIIWKDPSFRNRHSIKTSLMSKSRIQAGIHTDISLYQHLSYSEESVNKRKETYRKINHSQGEKNSQFGSMWITNGIENKKIKKVDNIPEGWYKGRKLKV